MTCISCASLQAPKYFCNSSNSAMAVPAGNILEDDRWQKTLDIDLRAAMQGTALAARAMIAKKTQGTR